MIVLTGIRHLTLGGYDFDRGETFCKELANTLGITEIKQILLSWGIWGDDEPSEVQLNLLLESELIIIVVPNKYPYPHYAELGSSVDLENLLKALGSNPPKILEIMIPDSGWYDECQAKTDYDRLMSE